MSLNLNPWLALLLGILIGWVLEWLLELWFFRRRRLECQRRLADVEARLRARDEELRREKIKTRALEDQLAVSLAVAPAIITAVEPPAVEVKVSQVEVLSPEEEAAAPEAQAELPEVELAAPEVQTRLAEIELAAPEVQAELPEVEIAAPELEAELPEVEITAPVIEAESPEVEIAAPEVEAELPEVEITAPVIEAESPEVEIAAPEVEAEAPAGEVATPDSTAVADDFEPLKGIGPVFEQRLHDAGICTYQALADATVEQLAAICKAPAWRTPDYANWITQAKEFLAQQGR
jgi:predicted flap endonuclease-1-like 5' DNA nuclease